MGVDVAGEALPSLAKLHLGCPEEAHSALQGHLGDLKHRVVVGGLISNFLPLLSGSTAATSSGRGLPLVQCLHLGAHNVVPTGDLRHYQAGVMEVLLLQLPLTPMDYVRMKLHTSDSSHHR